MEKLIECDCGWTCRGSNEHLIAECRVHARDVHGMELTPEQILAVAVPVEENEGPAVAP